MLLLHLTNILSATPATCWCLRRASTSRAGWLPEHECQNNTVDARYIATTMLHFNSLEPLLLDLTTMLLLQRSMQNYQLSCPRWILCCGWRAQWWYLRFRCPSHSSGCGHSPSHSVRCHCPWTDGIIRNGGQDMKWMWSVICWHIWRYGYWPIWGHVTTTPVRAIRGRSCRLTVWLGDCITLHYNDMY